MQEVTPPSDRAGRVIDYIASDLRHPGFGGVPSDTGEGNTPGLHVEKEEDVIRNQTTPGQDLNREEVCSGKDGHVSGDEVFPTRALAAPRCRRDAVPLQNVPDSLVRDVVAEVGERAGDPIVAPAFVLLGHADDQRFEFGSDTRTSWIRAMFRAVELAGDQTSIPGEDGFRFGNTGHLRQTFPSEPLADFGERRALGVGKSQTSGDVRAKDLILRDQVFALEEQALIDEASYVRQQPGAVVVSHVESAW